MSRRLDTATVASPFAFSKDTAMESRPAIRPDSHLTAIAVSSRRISLDGSACFHRDLLGMHELAAALPAAADFHFAAIITAGIDDAANFYVYRCCRDSYLAVLASQALGPHDPLLVDDGIREFFPRCCGHENQTSVGFDEALIRHYMLYCVLTGDNCYLAIPIEIQRNRFASC